MTPDKHPRYNGGVKYSRLLGKTLRNSPQYRRFRSFNLLIRGGYVRPLGQGLFSYLPLGMDVAEKIKSIIEEEIEGLGGLRVQVPLVNPRELWENSGRDRVAGKDLAAFQDRSGRRMVLAPTHEEAMVELVRRSLHSYRDFPILIYQHQVKFRDEEKTRCGTVRAREFVMSDAYSFHRSFSDLNNFFPKMFGAYKRIFERCGLPGIITADSGPGMMGGDRAYEFLVESECGDDGVLICDSCGYRANKEIARGIKKSSYAPPETMKKVSTPGCRTMNQLSEYLEVPLNRLAKTMVYKTEDGLVMAVVRGDYDVSEEKLAGVVGKPLFGLAGREDLENCGLIPGYLSPLMELPSGVKVVLDDAVADSSNIVFGANEEGSHYMNVNFGLDYEIETVDDIAMLTEEDTCLQCGGNLRQIRSLELGNIFKLGDWYSRSMNLTFHEEDGSTQYPFMGSYGIGLGRLIAAVAEKTHDEKGLVWPLEIAPYRYFLMGIGKSLAVKRVVNELAEMLGDEVLYDDRGESISVKFKDAELLGIPLRIVVSGRYLDEDKVEFLDRRTHKKWLVSRNRIREALEDWEQENLIL